MAFPPLRIPGPRSNFYIVKNLVRTYSSPPPQGFGFLLSVPTTVLLGIGVATILEVS
jgi:hypothetical protein